MELSFRSSFAGQAGNIASLYAAQESLLAPESCLPAHAVSALAFAADDVAEYHYAAVAERFDRRLSPVNFGLAMQQKKRKISFERKLEAGLHGAVIAACGDGWCQFPLRLKDIVNELEGDDDKANVALGAPRLTFTEAARSELLTEELARWDADVMMLSHGGNELFGGGRVAGLFQSFSYGAEVETLIIQSVLERLLSEIENDLVLCLEAEGRGTFLLAHAYHTPKLRENALWIGEACQSRPMPLSMTWVVLDIIWRQFAAVWDGSSGTQAPFVSSTWAAKSDSHPAGGSTSSTRGTLYFHAWPACSSVASSGCLSFHEPDWRKT